MRSCFGLLIIGVLVSVSASQECPPPNTGTFGACIEICDSNNDCNNGQLCCSNGCGHECMDPAVDPCANIACAAVLCSDLSAGLITPEGQCCPVCACQSSDGSTVAAGTSFMNDCNTCTCTSTGLAACTLIACPPTTPPTDMTSTLPTVEPTDPPCPVDGQVRVGCASPCNVTCANVDTLLFCPTSCLVNGCQCPSGTIIDEQSSTCVARSDCPATSTATASTPTSSPTASSPTTSSPTDGRFQTCPSVEPSNEGNCVDECSSDDQCQYDRICCANGCGGRTCSDSVEMCQLIQCDWPMCEDDAQPEFSPFSCCPYCPSTTIPPSVTPPTTSTRCTASDGTSVGVGETYMEQCNTCRCLEGGIGACTRIGCVGCTLTNGSWIGVGETYKNDCNLCTCSGPEREICTEKACDVGGPGRQGGGDGAGVVAIASLVTTTLCGLLSVLM